VDALRTIRYGHLPYNALFSEAFINHNFSAPLGIHPTYLSMYAALSAVHLLCCLLSMRPVAGKLACLAGMAVLAMGIVQLGSKAVLAAFLLLLCLSPFFPARVQGGKKIWILVMGVALFTAVLLGSSTSLQRRFVDGFVNDITNTNTGHTKEEYRIVRWKAALALAGRSPLWGYGTGSEMPLLRKEYFRRRLYNSYINELNTHNQYLAFLLTAGAAGLLVFLATLFLGFRQAVRNRDMMLFAFVLIVSMVSLSENILGVNKGIFFYAFFFPLLLFSSGRPGLYSPAGRQPYGRRIRFIQEGNTPDDSARHEPALH
jgi:O-antigen ligase